MKKLLLTTALVTSFASLAANAAGISTQEVEAAQQKWGEGIVTIGKADDPKKAAKKHIDKLYAYDQGEVLFKPTLASEDQFRGTKKEALSYFIGHDMEEDKGFALAPYTNVRFENEGIITDEDSALAMGNYYFTKTSGEEIKVEYSFGYIKDDEGHVRINLHHSSLPHSPE